MAAPAQRFLGERVSADAVAEDAELCGQTLIDGEATRIGAGARIENSYLRNVVVAPGARIVDAVIIADPDGAAHEHPKAGPAARWSICRKFPSVIAAGATVKASTLINSSVGENSVCHEVCLVDTILGPHNHCEKAYAQSVNSGAYVTVTGPTELAEAWLGHHACIDRCGYFEGSFINDFFVVEFDRAAGQLVVREILDVPHGSRYGLNTINCSNSGNLHEQPGGVLRSLGRHVGLWHDTLLSHEPIVLGPCCWVAGWTKVVGRPCRQHTSAEEFLSDPLATHLMPFSVNGFEAEAVSGQTLPGELNKGLGYKQRSPAWAFIYAPAAVIGMVRRVAELTGDTGLADRLVDLALKSALALIRYEAYRRGVDLRVSESMSAVGWNGWLIRAHSALETLIGSGVWTFRNGEPVNWRLQAGRWVPRKRDVLEAVAPDAGNRQFTEEELLACAMEPLARQLGVSDKELSPTLERSWIDPEAWVAPGAYVGPGVQVRGRSVVMENAWLYRTVVENSVIGAGARLMRSRVCQSLIGEQSLVISGAIRSGTLAACSRAVGARVQSSLIEGEARINPYAHIRKAVLRYPCIVGSTIGHADVHSVLMSYHMPGQSEYLIVEPSVVRHGDGRQVTVEAIPMLGGGIRVMGRRDCPVRMECAFIGSNAVLEAGAFVGFGCFVLGRLTGAEGLPPFTVSVGPGPQRDEIGMVVHRFANMVITHFINWAYQALGPGRAADIALLVPAMLREGRDAVAWALETRRSGKPWDPKSPYAKYKSLALYSESQLSAGLEAYESALADGRWEMAYENGELRFTGKGVWVVKDGTARWLSAVSHTEVPGGCEAAAPDR